MNIGQSLLCTLIAGTCLGAPLAFASPYSVSSSGDEVTDTRTGIIWRRCAEGMTWDGSTCTGKALSITHSSAENLALQEAKKSKKAWRLPSFKELKSLQAPEHPGQLLDPAAFPATPEMWFWSVFIDKPGVIDAFNIYFGSGMMGSFDGRDCQYGALRLVRSARKTSAKHK